MRSRVKLKIVIPLAVIAVLGLFAAVGVVTREGADSGAGAANAQQSVTEPVPRTADADAVMGSETGTAGKSTSGASVGEEGISAAVPPKAATSPRHLLRTGDLSLRVSRNTLLSTVDRIKSMTTGMGGYVMSSAVGSEKDVALQQSQTAIVVAEDEISTSSSGIGTNPYATLTVRVPERLFDAAVKRFSKLGDVQSVSTSSEDVTSQYVDLQARLHHYRAVEQRLVGFLADTANVNQMLAVQDRIDDVQLTIEQLTAQLKSLRETTTYGTLTILVREKGVPQPGSIDSSDTFAGTLWNSVRLLGDGARVTGLVLTALLPFVVVFGAIGLVVWYAVRRVRRARRRPAQPTLPV